jgi:hypothetical protein
MDRDFIISLYILLHTKLLLPIISSKQPGRDAKDQSLEPKLLLITHGTSMHPQICKESPWHDVMPIM